MELTVFFLGISVICLAGAFLAQLSRHRGELDEVRFRTYIDAALRSSDTAIQNMLEDTDRPPEAITWDLMVKLDEDIDSYLGGYGYVRNNSGSSDGPFVRMFRGSLGMFGR